MASFNKSARNCESSEQESVERALNFINTNKQVFEKFGLSLIQEKQNAANSAKNQSKFQETPGFSQGNANAMNSQRNQPNYPNNHEQKTNNFENLPQKSQMKSREMVSVLAQKNLSKAALKEKFQKECQSAINDINSNRIQQAINDLQNAISFLRELK